MVLLQYSTVLPLIRLHRLQLLMLSFRRKQNRFKRRSSICRILPPLSFSNQPCFVLQRFLFLKKKLIRKFNVIDSSLENGHGTKVLCLLTILIIHQTLDLIPNLLLLLNTLPHQYPNSFLFLIALLIQLLK